MRPVAALSAPMSEMLIAPRSCAIMVSPVKVDTLPWIVSKPGPAFCN